MYRVYQKAAVENYSLNQRAGKICKETSVSLRSYTPIGTSNTTFLKNLIFAN